MAAKPFVHSNAPTEKQLELKALLKERRDLLEEAFLLLSVQYREGKVPYWHLAQITRGLLRATLELHADPESRDVAIKKLDTRASENAAVAEALFKGGKVSGTDPDDAKISCLQIRIERLRFDPKQSPEKAAALKNLLKERYELLEKIGKVSLIRYQQGTLELSIIVQWSSDMYRATCDLDAGQEKLAAALDNLEKVAAENAKIAEAHSGVVRFYALHARASLLAVQIERLRKDQQAKPKK
jgi:hypothetical protein